MSLIHEVSDIFQNQKFPKKWKTIELNKVLKIQNGFAFKSSNFNSDGIGMPLIRIRDIKNLTMETFYDGIILEDFIVTEGDLIIGMDGDFNSNFWKGNPALLNQRVCRLIPDENFILKKLLYYGLPNYLNKINENTSSTTVKHLSSKSIGEIPFPLPPLAEQNRIVDKLDTLFVQLEIIKSSMANIPLLLKDFRQQVLSQAVTGKLLGETEFTNFSELEIKIKTGPFGSALHKSDYIDNGIAVINPSHIIKGRIVPDNKISIDENKFHELKRWKLENNDIILGRRGEMGRSAKYTDELGVLICGTGSLVLKVPKNVSADFLAHFLRSPFCVKFLEENSVGSTMINLNQKIIKSIPFPNLTLEQQLISVKKIESLFAKVDAIEQQYKTLKANIDTLPQALLHKAFKGELTEQLDSDGDARELLKQIQELKNSAVKPKKATCKKTKSYPEGDEVLGMVAETN